MYAQLEICGNLGTWFPGNMGARGKFEGRERKGKRREKRKEKKDEKERKEREKMVKIEEITSNGN